MKQKINASNKKDKSKDKSKSKNKNKKAINPGKILSKTEMALYDAVEQKDIELQNLKTTTKNIKKETIKEFVYSSKKIPVVWKSRKNFKNIVLETFVEDTDFLKYLGSVEEADSIHAKPKIHIRPKTASERKLSSNLKNFINKKNDKNKLALRTLDFLKSDSNISNYNSLSANNQYFKKPKIKLRKIISQQEEIQNMLDDLKEKYPLRNKLKELYPNLNLKEVDINFSIEQNNKESNKTVNASSIESLIDKSRLHKINKIERNIFNNLLLSNKKNNNNDNKFKQFLEENSCDNKINNRINKSNFNNYRFSKMIKNEKIKNELNDSMIFNQLKSTNFYGPYFSYCPYCCNNNIKYYKHMERKQCISLLNFIKKDRNRKAEIEESKFREKVKLDKISNIK